MMAKKSSPRRSLASSPEFHSIKKGQTLSQIARLYGLTLAQLKQRNNIQGNPLIHPGEKLRVKKKPAPAKDQKTYHIVQKGDTLIGIAKKHRISLPRLMNANSLSLKSILLTGTRLIIPK